MGGSSAKKKNKRDRGDGCGGGGGGGGATDAGISTEMCTTVLSMITKHTDVDIFLEPVDFVTLNILDYPRMITRPMDLGTVRKRLQGGEYASNDEFAADVRLTFNNAMLFNQEGDYNWTFAKNIATVFEQDKDGCGKRRMRAAPYSQEPRTAVVAACVVTRE
ncbi:Bromodomain-containing protein [Baffinella frigidus]|nr:Bromodomain-containing protein [Cryptophyta sp. CCMP2293]